MTSATGSARRERPAHAQSIGVLTSGGDSQGMNAAVRAVVRTALSRGVDVYAIYEGYRGMVDGGDYIRQMRWGDVGGILQRGGTIIGSARSAEFRTREGRRTAARNLIAHGIDRLVVIGGDGSLTGANIFRQEWPALLEELVAANEITSQQAARHPELFIVGLVGSIDNDMFGTDMTIGADTALHRITEDVDAIASTAASHQRTFVVEVMGRHCGYLALMSAIATGANWVLIPEFPPETDDWGADMCQALHAGRSIGRRHNIIIVAEGAQDRQGNPITSEYVKQVVEERLGEDTRITILGHVQRGGAPSAFDRYMSTVLGHAAVKELLAASPGHAPHLIGIRQHDVVRSPLMACVAQTQQVAEVIAAQEYDKAMALRGGSFAEAFAVLRTITRAQPHPPAPGQKSLRLAVLHAGEPAPGMNTAVRVAVRLGLDKGHTMLGVRNGIHGLLEGHVDELNWMSVSGWVARGGAELGTSNRPLVETDLALLARQLQALEIDGLLLIGGWTGYQIAYGMQQSRTEHAAFRIPIVCLPATIDNNLPGSDLSIGSDTALNTIISNVDKIKETGVATRRCYVVEVMGGDCGYLALMSGIATGAERIYIPEAGVSLDDLRADVAMLTEGFRQGKRLGLLIRNENADPYYTTGFMCALFEREGGALFEARQAILGQIQGGGHPSPFDRVQATRMAAHCIDFLSREADVATPAASCIGLQRGNLTFTPLHELPQLVDPIVQRPRAQWWLELQSIARIMAQPDPVRSGNRD